MIVAYRRTITGITAFSTAAILATIIDLDDDGGLFAPETFLTGLWHFSAGIDESHGFIHHSTSHVTIGDIKSAATAPQSYSRESLRVCV